MPANPRAAQPDPSLPQSRRLREIPGGYDINRWPISVGIGVEEPISAWLMRIAVRYELTPARILRELDRSCAAF